MLRRYETHEILFREACCYRSFGNFGASHRDDIISGCSQLQPLHQAPHGFNVRDPLSTIYPFAPGSHLSLDCRRKVIEHALGSASKRSAQSLNLGLCAARLYRCSRHRLTRVDVNANPPGRRRVRPIQKGRKSIGIASMHFRGSFSCVHSCLACNSVQWFTAFLATLGFRATPNL